MRNDNSNVSSDWNLEKVVINDTLGNSYRFPANVWLSNQPGKQLEMTFDLSKYQDLRFINPFQANVSFLYLLLGTLKTQAFYNNAIFVD